MDKESRKMVFLGIGSNIGDRTGNIIRAIEELRKLGSVEKISTVYESPPWGVKEQPPFLNCVVKLATPIEPKGLLSEVKKIERKIGRKERFRWGPREIDIDILLVEDSIIEEKDLTVPHPFLDQRDFFIVPLLEIEPQVLDPRRREPLAKALSSTELSLKPFCCVL